MNIQELGCERTPLGLLTLRRRGEPLLGGLEIFEVKLGDEYLMSSLFTESERQLARLGLDVLDGEFDVVIGGLGLGYTAAEALKNDSLKSLLVIDILQAVIDWHSEGLVPMSGLLTGDSRCELRQGDFFALSITGLDASAPERKFDAVLLDIDHSPKHYLDENSGSFYTSEGLASLRRQLKPAGCFALWSNDPADEDFTGRLETAFGTATAHDIEFSNPYTGLTSVNSVYVAKVDS